MKVNKSLSINNKMNSSPPTEKEIVLARDKALGRKKRRQYYDESVSATKKGYEKFKEKVREFHKKIPSNKEITAQIKSPLSRRVTKVYESGPRKGQEYTVRKSFVKDTRSRFGGRTYGIGGMTFHTPRRKLRKERKTTYGKTTGSVGRPKGTYKPRFIPGVGYRPIPAQQYYKILRRIKAAQESQAEGVNIQKTQILAKRGIPPQQAREIIQQQSVPVQPQINPQQAQIQAEMGRIQQMEPWARANAMNMLRRRIQVQNRLQNEGMTRQPIQEAPRQEISLMTGRPHIKQLNHQTERWLL